MGIASVYDLHWMMCSVVEANKVRQPGGQMTADGGPCFPGHLGKHNVGCPRLGVTADAALHFARSFNLSLRGGLEPKPAFGICIEIDDWVNSDEPAGIGKSPIP